MNIRRNSTLPLAVALFAVAAQARPDAALAQQCSQPEAKPLTPIVVDCQGAGPETPGYPVNTAELERALALSEALMKEGQVHFEKKNIRRKEGYVSVIDTGLVGAERDASTFAPVFGNLLNTYDSWPTSGGEVFKTFGESFADPNQLPEGVADKAYNPTLPTPLAQFPHFEHGTHVAGIVAGSSFNAGLTLRRKLAEMVRLNAFNAVGYIRTGVRNTCGTYTLTLDFVGKSMKIAYEQTAFDVPKILNLSLETQAKNMELPEYISNGNSMLVVAAGNMPIDLDSKHVNAARVFPAGLAGTSSDDSSRELHMIVVGAHDAADKLVPKTAYGSWTVDLAAPGCKIKSLVRMDGSESSEMTGTSQAAPFVSLTAGLLRALYDMDVDDIRFRINATVDLVPQLKGKVLSGGKLNMAKAVAAGFDILRLANGDILYGYYPDPGISFCNISGREATDLDLRSLGSRIDLSNTESGNVKVTLRQGSRDDSFTCPKGEIAQNFVRFAAYPSTGGAIGAAQAYPLDQVAEIIPTAMDAAVDFHRDVGKIAPIPSPVAVSWPPVAPVALLPPR